NDGGAAAGHWISLKLVGTRSNKDALGAFVTLTAGERRQVREVRSASSYMSQNDMRLHFGLGTATRVDSIEIRWPNKAKTRETIGPQEADRFLVLREGAGVVASARAGQTIAAGAAKGPGR
ncbi:MAG TPA: ASPIC/UnbV domain-containing protein, partial [Candidatus Polarisedimenticolia bacterium]|nr:ASPIC/UnbV domain-containing protein [Candidatus Polarisedimenticolia bacterium]